LLAESSFIGALFFFESRIMMLKARKIEWKGKVDAVWDYELFVGVIKSWMKKDKITKEQALDKWFDI